MEKLKIKIGLSPDYFKRPPNVRVSLNENVLFDGQIKESKIIEKEVELADESLHKLNITLYNKIKYDTVIEDDKIVKDTVIKIDQIEIDDIDISPMISLDNDKFYYIHDDSGEKHTFYDTMGVNGTSTVEFTTPFYVWLLETL